MNRPILRIALPSIVSNITVPLLGLVDTAISGHLGAAVYLGAIAVGTTLFSTTYWLFGFLRMGTGGLTAQALGAGCASECSAWLWRSLFLAMGIAITLLIFQTPILRVALALMPATAEVESLATVYFRWLIWGAPATLALFALNGWLLGMQDARSPMWVAIVQNVVNILASLTLVVGIGWKIEGIALGTLIAQWTGAIFAFILAVRRLRQENLSLSFGKVLVNGDRWRELFQVNRDIFLRTLCLVAVTFAFTAFGTQQGEILLAVNTLLMQFFLMVSYVMDGFAYAGEALGGRFLGEGNRRAFLLLTRRLFLWGGGLALAFTLVFVLGGTSFVRLLTDNLAVRTAASPYLFYAMAIPLVSFSAFLLDGLYIGTTSTRAMLWGMGFAGLVFFGTITLAPTVWGNHTLWIAFLLYLGFRGAVQGLLFPKILHRKFALSES